MYSKGVIDMTDDQKENVGNLFLKITGIYCSFMIFGAYLLSFTMLLSENMDNFYFGVKCLIFAIVSTFIIKKIHFS